MADENIVPVPLTAVVRTHKSIGYADLTNLIGGYIKDPAYRRFYEGTLQRLDPLVPEIAILRLFLAQEVAKERRKPPERRGRKKRTIIETTRIIVEQHLDDELAEVIAAAIDSGAVAEDTVKDAVSRFTTQLAHDITAIADKRAAEAVDGWDDAEKFLNIDRVQSLTNAICRLESARQKITADTDKLQLVSRFRMIADQLVALLVRRISDKELLREIGEELKQLFASAELDI